MSEATKHIGSCHCGKVRYEVKVDLTQPVMACNCSMCQRTGTYLSFAPESDFTLLSGADNLADYQFNKHRIHHLFCKTCGIKSFARANRPDGTPTVAINVRCLEDVDLEGLQVKMNNGRAY